MAKKYSISVEVKQELIGLWQPPRDFLKSLSLNGAISALFFFASLYFGTANKKVLPVAAAILLLWTLADSTLTNQIIFDKPKANAQIKEYGTYKRLFVVNNLTVVILSIPITILFGLSLVAILGKWSEIVNGLIIGFALIWGWLGISNVMSVALPFESQKISSLKSQKKQYIKFGIAYCLPWVIMPIYAVLVSLPFVLLGWATDSATTQQRIVAVFCLLGLSFMIWLYGLYLADRLAKNPNAKLQKLLYGADNGT